MPDVLSENQIPMETPNRTKQHLPEAILAEILARLPLRSISRFKSVCRTWKSALESVYFRRLFVSLHQTSSSSWSLLCRTKELISLHGCETWDLPNSLASYFRDFNTGQFYYEACSSGLILMNGYEGVSYVGNPVLQEWVEIPAPPHPYVTIVLGLVTRLDEDGVVLGFKVVKMASLVPKRAESLTWLCLFVYSSETGIWTRKRLHCPRYFTNVAIPISLNGTLYLSQTRLDLAGQPGALMVHDFYSESDLCWVIPLPDHNWNHNRDFSRALTTSSGFVMYIKTLAQDGDNLLKVWRLNHDSGDKCWQLLWEIRLPFHDIRYYAPMTMHPFDRSIVYLWSQENHCLISCNLRTQNYKVLGDDDHQDCFINHSKCDKFMDRVFKSRSVDEFPDVPFKLFQFVLPRWMESMPRPPQVEMIDTTSLLSYISSMSNKEEKEEEG